MKFAPFRLKKGDTCRIKREWSVIAKHYRTSVTIHNGDGTDALMRIYREGVCFAGLPFRFESANLNGVIKHFFPDGFSFFGRFFFASRGKYGIFLDSGDTPAYEEAYYDGRDNLGTRYSARIRVEKSKCEYLVAAWRTPPWHKCWQGQTSVFISDATDMERVIIQLGAPGDDSNTLYVIDDCPDLEILCVFFLRYILRGRDY